MNSYMSSGVDRTKDGKTCERCGRCCSALLCLSDAEIRKIHKYMKSHPEVKPVNKNNVLSKEFLDVCPFVGDDEGHTCQIYSVRPEICRHFLCANYGKPEAGVMNHRDKKVINMITEFMPDSPCPSAPDLKEINAFYEEKKKAAYGRKN